MTTRECKLEGMAICKVQIDGKKHKSEIVRTYISVPAEYTPDWQLDAYSWHDEGFYTYDLEDADVKYPDEYKYLTLDGEMKQGEGKITMLLEVIKEDLEESR